MPLHQKFIRRPDRRGNVIALSAATMAVVLAFAAFTVDIGFIELTKTQLQATADAAALAGAQKLSSNDPPALVRTNARAAAAEVASLFRNGNQPTLTLNTERDVEFGKLSWNSDLQRNTIQWGDQYTPYNVLRVHARRTADNTGDNTLPLFFAPAMGYKTAQVSANAIATFYPRDIMIVLDFSASMNDDSCFGAIPRLGQAAIESNLQTMWEQLGSPVYGNMTSAADYATFTGATANVTFKGTSLSATRKMTLSSVKLTFANGKTQTFTSGLTGTPLSLQGSGSNSSQVISSATFKSGSTTEVFTFNTGGFLNALNLNTVSYPYPGGNWSDYIGKVTSSSGDIAANGYRWKFGYMTWLHYMQYYYPSVYDSPDLWKTSEQPVGSMKDAVSLFLTYLKDMESADNVGLSIYTHNSNAGAILEHGLSSNLDQVSTTTQHRQAGHYTGATNIYAGMYVARQELTSNARPAANRLMVLMTDGVANLPNNTTIARQKVIDEANAAAAANIKILTIGLGLGADTALLQQVADITDGDFFNVPGGSSIADVQAQLEDTFKKIAAARTLKLISDQ